MQADTFREITTSPYYPYTRGFAETYDSFVQAMADYKAAMMAKFGPTSNLDEIACALVYDWAAVRRVRVGCDFRVIAPKVRKEVETAGHSWDQIINMMGSPKPGIAYAYTDNL